MIFVALIQATAGGIVWWIAGLPNPFFYGAVMFALSIIPFWIGVWRAGRGNRALRIDYSNGCHILLGTERAEELAAALKAIRDAP